MSSNSLDILSLIDEISETLENLSGGGPGGFYHENEEQWSLSRERLQLLCNNFLMWKERTGAAYQDDDPMCLARRITCRPEIERRVEVILDELHKYLVGASRARDLRSQVTFGFQTISASQLESAAAGLYNAIQDCIAWLNEIGTIIDAYCQSVELGYDQEKREAFDESYYIASVQRSLIDCKQPWLLSRFGRANARRHQLLTRTKAKRGQSLESTSEQVSLSDLSDSEGLSSGDSRESDESFSEVTGGGATISVPHLSSVPATIRESFLCPYCQKMQRFKTEKLWRKHVFEDLRAYICTFPDCALKMFQSKRQWISHEMDLHRRRWRCLFEGCDRYFNESSNLTSHIQSEHADVLSDYQIQLSVDASSRPQHLIPASACPLCTWHPPLQQLKYEANNVDEVAASYFMRHLAEHQQQIALLTIVDTSTVDHHRETAGEATGELRESRGESITGQASGSDDHQRSDLWHNLVSTASEAMTMAVAGNLIPAESAVPSPSSRLGISHAGVPPPAPGVEDAPTARDADSFPGHSFGEGLSRVRFWFSIQSMIAKDEGNERFEDGSWRPDRYDYGEWLPPRASEYNIRDLNDAHGVWYSFDQARTPRVTRQPRAPGPAQVTHYKTFSFYANNQRIWIYRGNALQYTVGDGRQEPPPRHESGSSSDDNDDDDGPDAGKGSDELENEINDELEDWRELSFNRYLRGYNDLASYATIRGQSDVLFAQRSNQTWPAEVLPTRYHLPPGSHTDIMSHGGLMMEIPTEIALIAFSVPPAQVQNALINSLKNTYVSSGQLGGGWIDKRGLVVRVYCERGAGDTLQMFEENRLGHGPFFP